MLAAMCCHERATFKNAVTIRDTLFPPPQNP